MFCLPAAPRPCPTYPGWTDVTDDTTEDSGEERFDLSKVTQIEFFGTDWAGTGQDFIEVRDLNITAAGQYEPVPICTAKQAGDDSELDTEGIVTAVFPLDFAFYIQTEGEPCGLRVLSGDMPEVGQSLLVRGIMGQDSFTQELQMYAGELRRQRFLTRSSE